MILLRLFQSFRKDKKLAEDVYLGHCSICGYDGEFQKNNPSFREGYQCPTCRSSLRYRGQAESILKIYGTSAGQDLTELAKDRVFFEVKYLRARCNGTISSIILGF